VLVYPYIEKLYWVSEESEIPHADEMIYYYFFAFH
jgi:hypothetical protein